MREDNSSVIARAFGEVLERQVFLFPEPMENGGFVPDTETYLTSCMTFTGVAHGGVMLAVPEAMALEMAANFLGLDPADPFVSDSRRVSLGEVLNVACSHMLSALYGRLEIFELSAPHLFSLTGLEMAILARKPGSLAFSVDGRQVLLQVSLCGQGAGGGSDAAR